MGLFSKLLKKDEDESIPYDAFKHELCSEDFVGQEKEREKGCDKCYNKHHDLCKGKNFSCEAFRPLIESNGDR